MDKHRTHRTAYSAASNSPGVLVCLLFFVASCSPLADDGNQGRTQSAPTTLIVAGTPTNVAYFPLIAQDNQRHTQTPTATLTNTPTPTATATSSPTPTTLPTPPGPDPTVPNLAVAFIGDQGLRDRSKAVLQLIADEGADVVIHAGDFDYQDNPDAWDAQINDILGANFPYFATVGNHDVAMWDGYQQKLEARLARINGDACSGDLGVKSACEFRGLFFLLSGVGTLGSEHTAYIGEQLTMNDSLWRVCAWHKNQSDMQVEGKDDEVGWGPYQECQEGGALIATGHAHTYSRTFTLTDLGNAAAGHGAIGQPAQMQVGAGKTFVFVSGLAGQSKRDYNAADHDDDTWWATIYAGGKYVKNGIEISDFNYDVGALFIEFYVDNDPNKARGYFKTIEGEIIDEFEITSTENDSASKD